MFPFHRSQRVGLAILVVVSLLTAAVLAQQTIRIREMQSLSFGQISRPSVGRNTFTVDWETGAVTRSGAGDAFYFGDAQNGRYRVHAQPFSLVHIDAQLQPFGAPGISVDALHLEGTRSNQTYVVDPGGVDWFHLGGIVTIDANAALGPHRTDVVITANYE